MLYVYRVQSNAKVETEEDDGKEENETIQRNPKLFENDYYDLSKVKKIEK